MKFACTAYNLAIEVAAVLARLCIPFNEKISRGLEDRKGLRDRWRSHTAGLDRRAPLVWFHVSSVGEFEQAKAVMRLLDERTGSKLNIALTFYSPSGMDYFEKFDRAKRVPSIRFVDYLPLDTKRNVRFCLDTLRPDMIVYVKFDLWPNLIMEAAAREIPQILVSGTLSPNSRRLSAVVRGFYGDLYSQLTAIAAISDEDAERFRKNARGEVEIITAGDTRFDQVCQRIDTSTIKLPDILLGDTRSFVIAGSTWPGDEEVVITGFAGLLEKHPEAALIVVPHEPTPERLKDIKGMLEKKNLASRLLSSLGDAMGIDEPVIIADGVGYLAELYRTGCMAYVGGSFSTGVHNVMEPAVLGLPVLFGPRIQNSLEARMLIDLGAGKIVTTASDFERETDLLLGDKKLMKKRGEIGREFIRNNCGAALHCIDLIEKHLNVKGLSRSNR